MNIVDDNEPTIGRRLREVRYWRRKSQRAVAELAGLSESYLSHLERGERPLDRRSTLEALAAALDVAPGELTGSHELIAGEGMGEVHAVVVALRVALADNSLDDPADDATRPWPELAADLHRVNSDLRPRADYAALGLVLPDLIADLHATAAPTPTTDVRRWWGCSTSTPPLLRRSSTSARPISRRWRRCTPVPWPPRWVPRPTPR